nr:MAG TPA: Putative N-acetylmuramoyl-L-alanine amidase [Caudoviricetes sp.]
MSKVLVLDAGHGGNGSTAGKRTLNGENDKRRDSHEQSISFRCGAWWKWFNSR